MLDGGTEFVYTDGATHDVTFSKGGQLDLGADSLIGRASVLAGGEFFLVSGFSVSDETVSAYVVPATTAIGEVTLASGAIFDLNLQTVVSDGEIDVGSGASTSATSVGNGGQKRFWRMGWPSRR